jgi:hypothetical protein
MLKIEIELTRLNEEEAQAQGIRAAALNDDKMTEAERLARDILAPLAVDQLFSEEGDFHQASAATFGKLGRLFLNCSAVCGGALWFCGDEQDRQALTLADGYHCRAFGRCCVGGCFILILQNREEKERAYLVRPNW